MKSALPALVLLAVLVAAELVNRFTRATYLFGSYSADDEFMTPADELELKFDKF